MSKITISKKSLITMKNGSSVDIAIIKPKTEKELITYDAITKLVSGIQKKGTNVKDLQIFGVSKAGNFTIKSANEDYDEDYIVNKPEDQRNALDGFFEVHIISRTAKNKK